MDIRQNTEDPIQIYDDLEFVEKQDVVAGQDNAPAYTIRGPRNYVIGIEQETPVAPEFRTADGTPVDDSAQVVFQKADVQGNPLGNAIIFQHNMGAFDYEEMRSDPEYFKYTNKPLLLKPREYLYVYLRLPSGADDFSASESRLTMGDNVTRTGKPAYIRHLREMSDEEKNLINRA
jgi:hypothetical protein